jgi:CRP-like cAMP-binding protein
MASVTDLLRQAEVFRGLSEPELREISRLLHERTLHQDQVLFRQGDPSDAVYIVLAGRVRISIVDAGGRSRVLAFQGAGELVGEMGLLSGEPRSATAMASTEVKLLQLRKSDFDALLANNLVLMRELGRVMNRYQDAMHQRAFEEVGPGAERAPGIVTVLFSPRGGAGVTTIATNLAVGLAQRAPDRVVLVDLNVLFGHVPVLLNLTPRTSLASISPIAFRQMDRDTLEFYFTTHPESSLRVLPAALHVEEQELVTGQHVSAALELLVRHFAYVIVDVGRGFSEVNLTAIERAANILMVCTPDRSGVRGIVECQRIFDSLLHVPVNGMQYLLNHPAPHATLSAEQIEQALNVRLVSTIPFGGDVPTRAALEGYPVLTRWAHSPVARSLATLVARLQQQSSEVAALASR